MPRIFRSHYYKFEDIEEKDFTKMSENELKEIIDFISNYENEDFPLDLDFTMFEISLLNKCRIKNLF